MFLRSLSGIGSSGKLVGRISPKFRPNPRQPFRVLTTSPLSMFRTITQMYKHTPPPPHPTPPHPTPPHPLHSPPERREWQAPPSLWGGGGGVGRGGGVCFYACVMFRNINREVVSSPFKMSIREYYGLFQNLFENKIDTSNPSFRPSLVDIRFHFVLRC